jgi:outer membrane biosynthesis protein TonB
MDTRQEGAEPERREGFGGRVRRFIDNELSRALDKDEPAPDAPATTAPIEEPAPAEPASQPVPAAEPATQPATAEPTNQQVPAAEPASQPATAEPASQPVPAAEPATQPATAEATSQPVPAAEPASQPTTAGTAGLRSERDAADSSAQRVGLLNDPAGLRDQWQQVQGTFVDDPQEAVHQASMLVERTLQEIHDNVTRGQISDPTSTEDLRVSFQRYREFFQRLLSA